MNQNFLLIYCPFIASFGAFCNGLFVGWSSQASIRLYDTYTENSYIPNIVATTVSLIFMISFAFLPESPRFLCFNRETNLAREIMAKFKNIDADIEEMLRIWSQRDQIVERNPLKILFDGTLQPKQLVTLFGLVIFEQLIGAISAFFYIHKILNLTHGEFTPEMTAILCCAIFTAGIASPNICSFIGKTKTVLVWSSTCMAISLGALGIYCMLQGTAWKIDDYKVIPLVLLGFFYFCFAIGPHTFTWQYVQETIPVEHFFNIRNLLVAVSWMVIFAITRVLPRLIDVIGVAWLFWYMSLMCLFLTIFSAVIVPEYKKLPEEKKLMYAGESSEGDV